MSETENCATPERTVTGGHNARAWDALAKRQAALARPANDKDFRDPLQTVDPLRWLGGSVAGRHVLCLAAGGGRQSALYAAAGAVVTVVDISSEMLSLDREVAAARGLDVRTVQASMDALPMLADRQFDVVVHPVSTCYVAEVMPVFHEVARVTRPDGVYVSQHKSPVSLQSGLRPTDEGYLLREPYYRTGPLKASEPSRVRERGTLEFLHRWEELVGGICRAGFLIEDLVEPLHADPSADPGNFGHRSQYVAPYLRIKARRASADSDKSVLRIE